MHLGYNYSGFAQGQIATSKLHISIVIPREQNYDDPLGKINSKRSNCNKSDEGDGGNDTRLSLLCRYKCISAGNMQID